MARPITTRLSRNITVYRDQVAVLPMTAAIEEFKLLLV
jgi:hypothetical protein